MRSDTPLPEPSPEAAGVGAEGADVEIFGRVGDLHADERSCGRDGLLVSGSVAARGRVFESWPERLHLALLVAAVVAVPFAWSACSDTPAACAQPETVDSDGWVSRFLDRVVFIHAAALCHARDVRDV